MCITCYTLQHYMDRLVRLSEGHFLTSYQFPATHLPSSRSVSLSVDLRSLMAICYGVLKAKTGLEKALVLIEIQGSF